MLRLVLDGYLRVLQCILLRLIDKLRIAIQTIDLCVVLLVGGGAEHQAIIIGCSLQQLTGFLVKLSEPRVLFYFFEDKPLLWIGAQDFLQKFDRAIGEEVRQLEVTLEYLLVE